MGVMHDFFRFRSYLASVFGDMCGLRKNDEMTEFWRKSWWEIAYSSHVFAFGTMAFWGVYYRFEVFYPMFLPWGLYLADRLLNWYRAYANVAPIIIAEAGKGASTYVVNSGAGDKAEPSHVRLLLKKPHGFTYKAGQWCQLCMPELGRYFGSPNAFLPLMQWHAFSIASKPTDDYLEFHIAVQATRDMLVDQLAMKVAKGERENFLKLSRAKKIVDYFCPHRVPFLGQESGASGNKGSKSARVRVQAMATNGYFTSETNGIYLTLKSDGRSIRTLRPQLQWTGRLWNKVNWLLEKGASEKDIPSQNVHISGPHGTLPYTIAAHKAVMLIGAGVGYPSTGAMLRQILEDNLTRSVDEKTHVCFMWTASSVSQLLLCFPSLLVDLTKYVHAKGLDDLRSWLHVKIFISNYEAGDFLGVNPTQALFPESQDMAKALETVRFWLLGQEAKRDIDGQQIDADGTYIARGSLGASFAGILQRSLFMRTVSDLGYSLAICFCGPSDLSSWIRKEASNTILPIKVEFAAEVAQ